MIRVWYWKTDGSIYSLDSNFIVTHCSLPQVPGSMAVGDRLVRYGSVDLRSMKIDQFIDGFLKSPACPAKQAWNCLDLLKPSLKQKIYSSLGKKVSSKHICHIV